jgi:NADPH:quinone reductase-like Zn-dependent oxidoreductase
MHNYGGSEVLMYEEVPRPEPGPGEVLVRVRASTVNPMDWKMREGYVRQWFDPPLPMTLGRDLAGDVVAVGEGVTDFQVGDAVFGTVHLGIGTHAEYAVVPAAELAPKPASLDYEQAAAVGLPALAAWQALVEQGGVGAGQTVLVHAAAGGVGSFAVQIAHQRGARVIGTASAANDEYVRSLGADEVIDYTTTPFEDVVRDVDFVLDTMGGDTQERSWGLVKPGGMLVTLVYLPPGAEEAAAARGVRTTLIGTRPDPGQLRELAALIEAGQIRPTVNIVHPLSETRQLQDLSQTGHTRGQLVLRVSEN